MRRIRPLCLACYTDKAEDASEHAGNGEYSRVTILARYSDSLSVRRLPRVAGSPLPFPSEILDREVAPQ
jgi:hypothetical protein